MKRSNLATFAAICLSTVTAYAGTPIASEAEMIKAINAIRAQGRTCPGGRTFPAASALVVNPKLTQAATSFAADFTWLSQNKYMANAGYLAFSSGVIWNGEANKFTAVAPDVNDIVASNGTVIPAAPKFWLTNQAACEAIMTAYAEAGVGVYAPAQQPGFAPTWPKLAVILAAPYDTAQVDSYRQRIFAEINKLRASGVNSSYAGAKCTSGPVAALKWNDKMAQAAQFHSDDYAGKGIVSGADGSPHTGSAGEDPNARIKAAGCSAGGSENVNFNFGMSPEMAVHGWITMSPGHCSNVFSQVPVAGIGIATSAKLQTDKNIGPIVTYNLGSDTGCSAASGSPMISYDAHVQDLGWQAEAYDGGTAGTTGQKLRMEAMRVKVKNPATGTGCRVLYQAHVQDTGWMAEVSDGAIAGTTGKGLRLEAFKVRLANCDPRYHVYYQAHVQDIGWMPEVSDGVAAGTTGQAKRIEAVKIRVAAQ